MRQDLLKWAHRDADADSEMQHPPALDPAVSLAEYAASSQRAPEPVGRTLRAAAERGFTGEIEFSFSAAVRVYCDAGHAYYAERDGDAPLGERLVAAGVIDEAQLRQGVIEVGDVEHLGRIFDRDHTIDRDAVLASTELMTDAVLSEIVALDASVSFMPYRHHRSGIHRWFVGPDQPASLRPLVGVPQFDRPLATSVPSPHPTDQPTAPSGPTAPERVSDEPELLIEWNEPGPVGFVAPSAAAPRSARPDEAAAASVDVSSEEPQGGATGHAGEPVGAPVLPPPPPTPPSQPVLPPPPPPTAFAPPPPPAAFTPEPALPEPAAVEPEPPVVVEPPVAVEPPVVVEPPAAVEPPVVVEPVDPEPTAPSVPTFAWSGLDVGAPQVAPVVEPAEFAEPDAPESTGVAAPTDAEVSDTIDPEPFAPMSIELAPWVLATDTVADAEPIELPDAEPDVAGDTNEAGLPPVAVGEALPEHAAAPVERAVEPVAEPMPAPAAPVGPTAEQAPSMSERPDDGPFVIRWPDGTEQYAEESAPRPRPALSDEPAPASPEPVVADDAVTPAAPTAPPAPAPVAAAIDGPTQPTSSTPTGLGLDLGTIHAAEPLETAQGHVPDDVAEAVRRALAAIERASTEPTTAPRLRVDQVDLAELHVPKLLDASVVPGAPESLAAPAADATPVAPGEHDERMSSSGAPAAFAPPSAGPTPTPGDTSAFAPPAAPLADPEPNALPPQPPALPEPGQASVVFLEPEPAPDPQERVGALRRLIGSLRRK